MILKRGVILDGLQQPMFVAIGFLLAAYASVGRELVLSSALDDAPGRKATSLHPKGLAVDARIAHLTGEQKGKILAFCKAKLDPLGYDTMIHGPVEHLHCEFDPRPGEQLWRREG